MRPLIDEARHLEIMKLVGEEAWRELLDQFCLDAAWILEGLAADAGEESLMRCRHALTGLAANFGFPRFAELSRTAVPAESGRLSTELALIRDLIFRSTASFG
jgi:HPt (histidine-containing phosphotransfer) domain-containing protein